MVSQETASSSAECSRDKPPFNFFRGFDNTGHRLSLAARTLSVIGVGVTTRVHVPGPLFDDFFYTDRAEI